MKQIVAIQNGLGNQMFDYAFYLALKRIYPKARITTYLFARRCDHNGLEIDRIFSLPLSEKKHDRIMMRMSQKVILSKQKTDFHRYIREIYVKASLYTSYRVMYGEARNTLSRCTILYLE